MTTAEPSAMGRTTRLATAAWDEFVYGGHFLAVGDALTLWALGLVAGIPVTWDSLVIVYLCVFAGNLHDRWADADQDAVGNPVRAKVMAKYFRLYWPITIVYLGLAAFLLLKYANVAVLFYAVGVVAIAMLYTVVLKPLTKYVVGFKSYVVALFYALMVPVLAAYYGQPVDLAVVLVFAFYFTRIFISSAACDMKDTESDGDSGLKTLAVHYGKEKTARILGVVNVITAIPIVAGIYLGVLPMFAAAILLTIPYAFYYLQPNQSVDNETFVSLIIDGEFPLWLPLVLIGRALL